MAVINTIASKSAGCGGGAINTGDLGCDISFGLVIHALGFAKGTVISKDVELTLPLIEALIQKGDIIPLMDAFSSEPTMSEDTLETSPLGVEALTLKGLPKYALTMKKGQEYYKQMAKLTEIGNLQLTETETLQVLQQVKLWQLSQLLLRQLKLKRKLLLSN
jgi:hypothetical protein